MREQFERVHVLGLEQSEVPVVERRQLRFGFILFAHIHDATRSVNRP